MRLSSLAPFGALLALMAFVPAPAEAAQILLSNESSTTITFVYASTCDDEEWGEDLLPVDIVEPGAGAIITVSPGCWDLKAITVEGQELEQYSVSLDADESIDWVVTDVPAPAEAAQILLSNESSTTITFVYASTCDDEEWGEDLLPVDIVEPGAGAIITVSPGCWDLKAITVEGQELEQYSVSLDADESIDWVVTDAE